jgi:hypothetical protein
LRGARRDRRLEHILGPIDLGAAIAILFVAFIAVTIASTAVAARTITALLLSAIAGISLADFTCGLCDIDETLSYALTGYSNNVS